MVQYLRSLKYTQGLVGVSDELIKLMAMFFILILISVVGVVTYYIVVLKHDKKVMIERNALYDKDLEIIARSVLDHLSLAEQLSEYLNELDAENELLRQQIKLAKERNFDSTQK